MFLAGRALFPRLRLPSRDGRPALLAGLSSSALAPRVPRREACEKRESQSRIRILRLSFLRPSGRVLGGEPDPRCQPITDIPCATCSMCYDNLCYALLWWALYIKRVGRHCSPVSRSPNAMVDAATLLFLRGPRVTAALPVSVK